MTETEKQPTPTGTKGSETDPQEQDEVNKNPSALDVIKTLIDPQEEEKASVFMKGHISKSAIEDTFLFEAQEVYPESTLRINC